MAKETNIEDLDRQFGIPGTAQVVAGNGGLAKVRIISQSCTGEIYLHGGHVTSWIPANDSEVLFLSTQSRWQDGKAIRGGVPVCFPWFRGKTDDPAAPAHGFVRTKAWELESIRETTDGIVVSVVTASDESTQRWWPGDFRLVHRATFGSKLALELDVGNTGTSPLRFEEALHSYFWVADISSARVRGLDGVQYLDDLDSNRENSQHGDIVVTSPIDRAYLDTAGAVVIDDFAMRRQINLQKENSLTTVVWNPWQEGAQALGDLGADEWRQMLCVEASNVMGYAVMLAPGQNHIMKVSISLTA